MKIQHPDWDKTIRSVQQIVDYIAARERATQKEVVLLDMQHHPRQEVVTGLLGTVDTTPIEIRVFISKQMIDVHQARKEVMLQQVVVHELLHDEMDQEGFPATRNKAAYENDATTSRMGSAVQCSVLHLELNRRHRASGLPMGALVAEQYSLMQQLTQLGMDGTRIDQGDLARLLQPLATPLTPTMARERIQKLIDTLGLLDRLEVSSPC